MQPVTFLEALEYAHNKKIVLPDEFSIYQRKKLGHYFDIRDEYFKMWLNAKRVYSGEVDNATSHIS